MCRKAVAVIFIIVIFVVGAFTLSASKDGVKELDNLSFNHESVAQVEGVLDENIYKRNRWININGAFQKVLNKTADEQKDWYRLDNGQMIYSLSKVEDKKLEQCVNNLLDLEAYASDTDFYYVQLPFKVKEDSEMPLGCQEYGNDNADYIVGKLKEKGVNVLDIRERINEEGFDRSELFYMTDQHWTARTALWAAGEISSFMADNGDWKHDKSLFDINNYNVKVYRDWFLGSIGKKTGNIYAGTDDFELITPKWDTSFDFVADTANGIIKRKGDFKEALCNTSNLKKDYFNVNTYATYTGGDFKENTVRNADAVNNKRILLIRDSFSCALLPYLAVSTDTVTTIDLRHYDKMSLKEYISKNDFDIILIAYNPSAITDVQFSFD